MACICPITCEYWGSHCLGATGKFMFTRLVFVLSVDFMNMESLSFQLGNLIGCVIQLKPAVAGITIIALGTSLPDTFASRTAALHDEHADAAIGNVTGLMTYKLSLDIVAFI